MDITVPDIGHFIDVPVIEVQVATGDVVAPEDPLITLESDKAMLDIPAPVAGTITAVRVAVGDHVSAGHVIADLRTGQQPVPEAGAAEPGSAAAASTIAASGDVTADVLVLGAGPGGYTAAFRAADLGQSVVLVDREPTLGGVCLNVGCIPSKALLHAAKVIAETKEMSEHGIVFGAPAIDVGKLRAWKDGVVGRLTGGLAGLARQRKVTTIRRYGRFSSPHQLQVELAEGGTTTVDFAQAIIAAGSEPLTLPFIPQADPRVGRLHRRAGARRGPGAAARPRRRDHRARDGHRLPRARRQGHHRRADGPAHPRSRQGPDQPAGQAGHPAGREHLPQDHGDRRRSPALKPEDRVAGLFVLLYAQWPATISRLTLGHVQAAGDQVRIRLGCEPDVLPEPLGALVLQLVATRRGHAAIGDQGTSAWLFPGGQPDGPSALSA